VAFNSIIFSTKTNYSILGHDSCGVGPTERKLVLKQVKKPELLFIVGNGSQRWKLFLPQLALL
jgi:hypothetical protein